MQVRKECQEDTTPGLMWDKAIADVELKLSRAKKRVEALTRALANFRVQKEQGVPWPEKSTTQN